MDEYGIASASALRTETLLNGAALSEKRTISAVGLCVATMLRFLSEAIWWTDGSDRPMVASAWPERALSRSVGSDEMNLRMISLDAIGVPGWYCASRYGPPPALWPAIHSLTLFFLTPPCRSTTPLSTIPPPGCGRTRRKCGS